MLHSLGKFSVTGVVFNMVVIVGVAFMGKKILTQDLQNNIKDKLSNTMVFSQWTIRMCNYSNPKLFPYAIYLFYFKEYQAFSTLS